MATDILFQGLSCVVHDLGLIDYVQALQRQREEVERVVKEDVAALLLCEHPTVLTLGRLATEANILYPREYFNKLGIDMIRIDRGGEITLHAPGQLVIYPILNLNRFGRDLRRYLQKLEQVAVDLLQEFDIVATSFEGKRGVWVGAKKIASIGVGVKKWVTYHGMAVNVNTDLRLFSMIRPCGLDVQMTSINVLSATTVDMGQVKRKIVENFIRHFHLSIQGYYREVPRA